MGKKAKYSGFGMESYRPRPISGRAVGPVLLACEKCEQRLAKEGRFRQIAQFQQAMTDIAANAEANGTGLTILPVSCLDVCPRGAMAVAISAPRGRGPARTMVVRTAEELREVCDDLVQSHLGSSADAPIAASNAQAGGVNRDPQTSSQDNF